MITNKSIKNERPFENMGFNRKQFDDLGPQNEQNHFSWPVKNPVEHRNPEKHQLNMALVTSKV